MPIILRLCLYVVDKKATDSRTQVWLSLSVDPDTTPKTVLHRARTMVEERMAAQLEAPEAQMALCVRDAKDHFIFLGTAMMAAAAIFIVQMPFLAQLLHAEQQRRHDDQQQQKQQQQQKGKSAWNKFVFVQGVLVPLPELWRLNCANDPAGDGSSVPLYAAVTIPAALGRDPVDPAEPDKDPGSVRVYYVDFTGKRYVANVRVFLDNAGPRRTARLCDVMQAACESIGAQVGCALDPSNMVLMCRVGSQATHPIETDAALRIALGESNAKFILAANPQLLATPSPPRSAPCGQPQLMLREDETGAAIGAENRVKAGIGAENRVKAGIGAEDRDRDNGCQLFSYDENATDSSAANYAYAINDRIGVKEPTYVRLASTTATIRQLACVEPEPSFMPCDRDSILRQRPFETAAAVNAVNEEDAARLRLAAAHVRLDEAYDQYCAATECGGKHDAELDELLKRKAVLTEEWAECLSADRDCERLEILIEWLEKDLAEGHTRQEQLIRAIYSS